MDNAAASTPAARTIALMHSSNMVLSKVFGLDSKESVNAIRSIREGSIPSPNAKSDFFRENAMNKKLWVLGHKVTFIETKGDYSMLEVSATPNVPGPPPHYHKDAPELFYITSGELDVMEEGKWHTLKQGESLIVSERNIHTFKNNTANKSTFITTWSPKGFEGFFLEFGIPIENENAFNESISDQMIKRAIEGCSRYGMVVVD